jgi:hypothetical protein
MVIILQIGRYHYGSKFVSPDPLSGHLTHTLKNNTTMITGIEFTPKWIAVEALQHDQQCSTHGE